MTSTDVVIVGAGPNGLSIAAHLSARGVRRRILGDPMGTWRKQMPTGMYMKSEPYGSDFAAPKAGFGVADYCRTHGLDYVARLGPLLMSRFLDYSDWYRDNLVPDVENLVVRSIVSTAGGFIVETDSGERIETRRVVVATGIAPFAKLPEELATLPEHLVSHTIDHHDLTKFKGQTIAVIGAGQSALETAALLHETGAEVHVVARRPEIPWLAPNPVRVSPLGRVRRPVNKLCEGWHCKYWNSPFLFRRLPEEMRVVKATSVLGPAGSWWLKDRVVGHIDLLPGHKILGAQPSGSGVRLELSGPTHSELEVDHVIAGTGFRVDITTLGFIDSQLQSRISKVAGSPVLSRSCESSVPGLFFVGAPAAISLGPSMRFVAGTHNMAAQVARRIARTTSGRAPQYHPQSAEVSQVAGI
jgi:FAD-dependent urate hydroxylase